jgi:hypothetical protein
MEPVRGLLPTAQTVGVHYPVRRVLPASLSMLRACGRMLECVLLRGLVDYRPWAGWTQLAGRMVSEVARGTQGYVRDVARMMDTLGGEEALVQAGPLELRYRPDDPLSHPLYGELHRTPCNLLLRLTRPRQPPTAQQVRARRSFTASLATPPMPPLSSTPSSSAHG